MRSEKQSHLLIYKYGSNSLINNYPLSIERKSEIRNYYRTFGLNINTRWHETFFAANGNDDNRYISEYHFYQYIEPHFNDMRMSRIFTDKNLNSRIFSDISQPKTVARYIRNRLYSDSYKLIDENTVIKKLITLVGSAIIKPSVQSGSGRHVNIIKAENGSLVLNEKKVHFEEIFNLYKSGFIIQERVNQHNDLDSLYPHSLNTIKLVSFRYQDEISLLAALFRVGNHGHYLDNMHQGGLCCGIKSNGQLRNVAYNDKLQKIREHPYTNIPFDSIIIPNFSKTVEAVFKLHESNLYCDIASWDICIDKTGSPILIETNLKNQGILFQQIVDGPLFGEFTESVLSKVFVERTG